jgi:heat shock protein HslJ
VAIRGLTSDSFSLQGNATALKTGHASATLAVLFLVSGLAQPDPLAGSEWRPTCMQGRALSTHVTAFIQFRGGGRLLAHAGCNRLLGEYRLEDQQILLGPLSSTRKACDAAVMRQERALIGTLQKVRSFRRVRTRLLLFGADGLPILELRQTDWD